MLGEVHLWQTDLEEAHWYVNNHTCHNPKAGKADGTDVWNFLLHPQLHYILLNHCLIDVSLSFPQPLAALVPTEPY